MFALLTFAVLYHLLVPLGYNACPGHMMLNRDLLINILLHNTRGQNLIKCVNNVQYFQVLQHPKRH